MSTPAPAPAPSPAPSPSPSPSPPNLGSAPYLVLVDVPTPVSVFSSIISASTAFTATVLPNPQIVYNPPSYYFAPSPT